MVGLRFALFGIDLFNVWVARSMRPARGAGSDQKATLKIQTARVLDSLHFERRFLIADDRLRRPSGRTRRLSIFGDLVLSWPSDFE
jgi:hypothetical protein